GERKKQVRRTTREKTCSGKQRRKSADAWMEDPRHNRAHRPNEILRRVIRRRDMAKPDPGGHIFWRVGNQRKKQQRAEKKENESEDFAPSALFICAGHRI